MTAYGDIVIESRPTLDFLPKTIDFNAVLGPCVIDYCREDDMEQARAILNEAIRDGGSYPQEEELSLDGFRAYFLSHDAFVVRHETTVVGIFYIKPNFPGRCSHICNGGFVVPKAYRRRGIARCMGTHFKIFAKALGYRASFFNLVFVSNEASVQLWKALGFQETGRVPKAGRLKGHDELVDALQLYHSFDDE